MNDMIILSRDDEIARVIDNKLIVIDKARLPIRLRNTHYVEGWLESRAIDEHRTNSRLLKRALRLAHTDNLSTALHFNAVTITDTYWVKPIGSLLTYSDVRFNRNTFDMLALRGDVNSFNQHPSRTPELTNTGSFEKCWRLIDGTWWMYKVGKPEELFTELFACNLAKAMQLDVAEYELDGDFIRTRDFTNSASVNFEPAESIIGDEADYSSIYHMLKRESPILARPYVSMLFFDALIFNMDRHEQNFGVIRDVETGIITNFAPLFDHNIALITRGYSNDVTRERDMMISTFGEFLRDEGIAFTPPKLTLSMIDAALASVPVAVKRGSNAICTSIEPRSFVLEYIASGYRLLEEICKGTQRKVRTEPDR